MSKVLKFILKTALALIVAIMLLAVYSRYIEPYRLTVTEVSATNKNVAANADGITVAVFADTHFSVNYTLKNFEKAINTINSRNPDIILFCGDLIDDYSVYEEDTGEISDALARLSAPMGKFAVYGNHDHGGGARRAYAGIMENGGFQVLINESVEYGGIKLVLIGLDDFIWGDGNTETVKNAAKPDCFNLVLCHEPDVVDSLLDCGIDLMVAGHTHGGQINIGQANLPIYKHLFFPPYGRNYVKGSYSFENAANTTLYVNSGLASTILPLRFMAPPEITFIAIAGP